MRVLLACALLAAATGQPARFLTYAQVDDILRTFGRTDDAPAWDAWVRNEDREVRARIDRGVEDSISNLVLYGTTFTKLPRLSSPESAVNAAGELVEPARERVRAAAAALARPSANERHQFARDFLLRHGIDPDKLGSVLASNLTRFALEQRDYQERLRAAHAQGDPGAELFVRSTLFDTRGLSVDTSLLPNYALEDTLRAMMRKGALAPGSIRSIAVIGPGLDFTDKRDGYDFYPLQTIQPFAVLEAVLRLDLGRPDTLRLTTLDLNSAVNSHLDRAVKRARAGTPYVIQLPRDLSADWTPQAVSYWEHFGELLGSAAPAAPAPKGLVVRAIAVQPKYALLIEPPLDLDIVAQVLDGRRFDLVVATNILVYYDRFHQALAMASIAEMMNPSGVFLSNTVLPAQRPAGLEYLGRRSLSYSLSGSYGDDVVVYRRK
jgi:hypothetical protein